MSRHVRVKIDLCLEFDHDLTSLPIDGEEVRLASAFKEVPGVVAITSPWNFGFSLDMRKDRH